IGLGSIGTIGKGGGGGSGQGYGTGSGRLGGSKRTTSKVTAAGTVVTGALPKEVIQRIVRLSHNRLRHCYEQGLQKHPTLAGKVTTKFTIGPEGAVSAAKSEGLSDASVVSCVEKTFLSMAFPKPDKGGVVVVSYPVVFAPSEDSSSASGAAASAPAATEPRIAGKPIAEVGIADLEKAMKDLGMTNITRAEPPSIKGASVLSASKGKQQYTITFVPSSAGIKSLPSEEKRRMDSGAGIEKDGSALVIAGPDQASARALLDALTTRK
ncbi:MAG: AgmX/PglI C-terminal domain-containing protein, partial [Myxococcales bacterium]|nr:AgmX/PglI C-terminal domain-containing protein [Myxococcales bacterium]